ncbi:hypothetical protein CR513_36790, partial [Mucuna pruriens]
IVHLCSVCLHSAGTKSDYLYRDHLGSVSAKRYSASAEGSRCIPEAEINLVRQLCHAAPRDGHYGSTQTVRKVLDCGLYWPTIFRDA